MGHAFVSYSSEDRPFVQKLTADLKAAGLDVWLDVERIQGVRPYWEEIQEAVESCTAFIFVVSPDTIQPDCGAMDELYHAKAMRPTPRFVVIVAREVAYEKMPIVISPGRYQYHDFVNNAYDDMLPKVKLALGLEESKADPIRAPKNVDIAPEIREKNKPLMTLRGHASWVISAQFSPDGKTILTGSYDSKAMAWSAASGEPIGIYAGHDAEVNSAYFSPDGQRLVTASFDGSARVWDAFSGDTILALPVHSERVYDARFSPDGSRILTATAENEAFLWDAASGAQLLKLVGHTEGLDCAVFSQDGTKIATGGYDHTARIWDAKTGEELLVLEGHESPLFGVNFSPDGSLVVTTASDFSTRLWDAETGESVWVAESEHRTTRRPNFSPSGHIIAAACFDGVARLRKTENGEIIRGFKYMDGIMVGEAAFSPDGKLLAVATADVTQIWDISDYDA